jgi:hypothetical protein
VHQRNFDPSNDNFARWLYEDIIPHFQQSEEEEDQHFHTSEEKTRFSCQILFKTKYLPPQTPKTSLQKAQDKKGQKKWAKKPFVILKSITWAHCPNQNFSLFPKLAQSQKITN